MFSVWNASAFSSAAAAPAARSTAGTGSDRSRSPVKSAAPELAHRGAAPDASLPAPAWSTGNRTADSWLSKHHLDGDVLARFAAVPQHRRKSIVLRCMEKCPDNLAAWLSACSRNHQDQDLERRLTGGASVHRSTSVSPGGVSVAASSDSNPHSTVGRASFPESAGMEGAVQRSGKAVEHAVAETSPPAFSQSLFKLWPRDKSNMLAELGTTLQPETFGEVLGLVPTDQSALAFAIMIAAPLEGTDRDVLVRQWLRRYSALRGQSSPSLAVSAASSTLAAKKLRLQFVMGGFSVCEAAVIVGVLKQVLPQFHLGVALEFAPVIWIPNQEPADVSPEDTFGLFAVDLHNKIRSFQEFADNLESLWQAWEREQTKVITLTNVGPLATSRRALQKLSSADIHAPDLRWVWMMIQASHALRSRMGDEAVADLLLGPQLMDHTLPEQLKLLWGPELGLRTAPSGDHGPLASRPRVWSTPGNFSVVSVLEQKQDLQSPVDGWTGPSAEQVVATMRDASPLPCTVARLAVTRLFQERELSASECQIMQTYITVNASGDKRLPSRAWWLRAHGMAGTPAEAVLTESFRPCLGLIISTTGHGAPPGVPAAVASPCGAERYCRSCEAFLDLLSTCYDTVWTTDMLLAFVGKCVSTWTKSPAGSGVPWERSTQCDRTHHCIDGCKLAR